MRRNHTVRTAGYSSKTIEIPRPLVREIETTVTTENKAYNTWKRVHILAEIKVRGIGHRFRGREGNLPINFFIRLLEEHDERYQYHIFEPLRCSDEVEVRYRGSEVWKKAAVLQVYGNGFCDVEMMESKEIRRRVVRALVRRISHNENNSSDEEPAAQPIVCMSPRTLSLKKNICNSNSEKGRENIEVDGVESGNSYSKNVIVSKFNDIREENDDQNHEKRSEMDPYSTSRAENQAI